jgi:subtilisin family serine protease
MGYVHRSSTAIIVLALASAGAFAQTDLLAEVLRLQDAARAARTERLAGAFGLSTDRVLSPQGILQLVDFDEHGPLYLSTHTNAMSAVTIRVNQLHKPNGTLTGFGSTIGIWDGGHILLTHQEFINRTFLGDGPFGPADHPTHVAGTAAASGISPNAKGMAFKASKIFSYDWNSDLTEMAAAASLGSIRVSNHSYGFVAGWQFGAPFAGAWGWFGNPAATEDFKFGLYDSTARDHDQIARTYPNYTIFRSAGNDRNQGPPNQPIGHYEWNGSQWVWTTAVRPLDGAPAGYDTIPMTANAKNIVTIGAVGAVPNYTGPASVPMSSYSSWGPTDDGRIKPDLVAQGDSVWSTMAANNAAYGTMSGTSMASPAAAGAGVLLNQLIGASLGSNTPSHVLKGLLIHTADECGPAPGPDYMFGWGLINAKRAHDYWKNLASGSSIDVTLNSGQTYFTTIIHSGGPLKVTICWTDVPGPVSANVVDSPTLRLVNDLDLRVRRSPFGIWRAPWVLNPAMPSAPATTGDNFRDNVEQVMFANAVPGLYQIRVSHKGALVGGSQRFAIFTS